MPSAGIVGRWEGTWQSEANGHHGKLRCLISQTTNRTYSARFRATYFHVLKFSYTIAMVGTVSNSIYHFTGEEDLGATAGGIYHYSGTITATNFVSTYSNKYDFGTFQLSRP